MDALPLLIGRYQIRQQLGQGGMGVLYLAFDPTMDRLVALKLLKVNDAQWRERFLREARLVARLQHPNIITIHDVGSSDGQPFMAMEYIAGDTLDTIVRRQVPLSHARKLEIMIALCDGLAYAHRSGVIHRDVKPSNLIVHRDSGLLKVLDFGIARTVDSSLTLAGSIIGTPNYMSPEQVQGQAVDHRSDVFAVGVVLYELFAHRQAFSGDTPFLVLQEIVHRTPAPLVQIDPTVDPRLDQIVSRAIAKDPQDRYPDLDAMRRDLIEALRHTAQNEPWGREKTMVLLARAAGAAGTGTSRAGGSSSSGGSRADRASSERLALVTPPPSPPSSGESRWFPPPATPTPDGAELGDDGLTNVPLTPTDPFDPADLASPESDATHVVPQSLTPTVVEPEQPPAALPVVAAQAAVPRDAADADAADAPRLGFPLGRAGFDARLVRVGLLAAAAVLLLVVLPAFVISSRSAARTPVAAPAAAPLTRDALPQQTAPLAPAVAGESAVTITPAPAPAPAPASPRVAAKGTPPVSQPGPLRGIEAPPEPAAGRSELKAMQQALDRWKQAYEHRDVEAVSRVWPTISTAQARSLDTAFDKMSQMTMLFRQCSLTGSMQRGSATCRVERSITFKTGRTETIPSRVVFQLEKRAARWMIVDVRGA